MEPDHRRRETLAKRCSALVRGPPADVARLLACYLFGICDLCGFNVDLCRFWMRTARQRLGQATSQERVALLLYDLAFLRPDMSLEAEPVPGNKTYLVLYPFGRRRERNLWIAVEDLPVLVREAIHFILASGDLSSHGQIEWPAILWYESYGMGNRIMAKMLDGGDSQDLRVAFLAAAMRAFYLETKEITKHYLGDDDAEGKEEAREPALKRRRKVTAEKPGGGSLPGRSRAYGKGLKRGEPDELGDLIHHHHHDDEAESCTAIARRYAIKHLAGAIEVALSRMDPTDPNGMALNRAFGHMRDLGFSKEALRSLGEEARKTLHLPSSASPHVEFLQ